MFIHVKPNPRTTQVNERLRRVQMHKSTKNRVRVWACVYRVEGSSPGLIKFFHENYLCFSYAVKIATAILIRSSVVRANLNSDIERLTSKLT